VCVTDAATEVTVSADVEKMKTDETPMRDAVAASDVKVDIEPRAADATESKPDLNIPQQATAEPVAAEDSILKPPPTEPEVSTKVVEGDVVKLSEEKYSEDTRNDGATVRKKLTTTKHMHPVTTIVRKVGGVEEKFTVDKLLGTEVDEHVLILEPGVLQLRKDQLENETEVEESDDTVEDGTWVKRKVTTVTVKCKKTLSSVPATEQLAVDQKVAQLPASAVVSAEVPLKESLPGVSVHRQDVTKASLEEQLPRLDDDHSAKRPESETRRSEDEQSAPSQSKPSIVPVKLTKLEPLSKDRTGVAADADVRKPAELEQKSSTDERDTMTPQQTRSGSPSLSVVRLTKLEPLSFERSNGSTVSDQPRAEPTAETRDGSSLQRAPVLPGQPTDRPEEPSVAQPTTEDMIVPVPSTRQMRGRPAWLETTTAPQDDDLDLRAAVEEPTIQVEQTVDQFAVPPSNIKPAVEQEIRETLASTPGSVT